MDGVFFDAEDQPKANAAASASKTTNDKAESKRLNAKEDGNCGTTGEESPAVLGK